MLTFEPGASLAHRLDPRTKLLFQFGLALAAFARPEPWWLGTLGLIALGALAAARLSPGRVLVSYRYVLLVLLLAPLLAGLTLGSPWLRVDRSLESGVLVARIVPVLLVSAVYTTTTPVRETRAAIQRHVPGRPGQALGVGVGLVFRFFPLVLADVRATHAAIHARGGASRSLRDRARRLAIGSLGRSGERAAHLSTALQARCFAWNPTLPALQFSRLDYPVLVLAAGLALSPLL